MTSAIMLCLAIGAPRVIGAEEAGSDDAATHLTFASIMFYKGRHLLQAEDAAAVITFKLVEQELLLALQLADRDQNERRRQLVKSQSAYILGDIYFFVFKDQEKAKTYYEEAVHAFPEHEGAQEALKRLAPPTLLTPP